MLKTEPVATPRPWWREPMLWLVLGGPLAVVLAALATAVIAVRGADPVLPTTATPAVQARNHVMSPPPAPAAAR